MDYQPDIRVEFTRDRERPWKLIDPLVLELSNEDSMVIPKGYTTDFASVPKPYILSVMTAALFGYVYGNVGMTVSLIVVIFTYTLTSTRDLDLSAFIMHDYMYGNGGYIDIYGKQKKVSRLFADKEMRYQQYISGVGPFRIMIMYMAVRIFGIFNFKSS